MRVVVAVAAAAADVESASGGGIEGGAIGIVIAIANDVNVNVFGIVAVADVGDCAKGD